MLHSVCLLGGPPWGFRFATTNDGSIVVAQVLPDGRADREGIRVGDVIEAINGEQCPDMGTLQSKMRNAQSMLKLTVCRDPQRRIDQHLGRPPSVLKKTSYPVHFPSVTFADMTEEPKLNSDAPLTIETSEQPIPHPRQRNFIGALSPRINTHRVGHISLPQKTAEYMSVDGYSGGHRGSTEDKRRFFEMIANRQQLSQPHSQTDRLLHQKIQMGGSIGLPSDQTTVISGYDSVGGDFAALHRSTTTTEASRHSPTSCDLTEDEWAQDKPHGAIHLAGMLSPGKPSGDMPSANRYTPVCFSPPPQQQTENDRNGFHQRSPTPLATEENTVVKSAATALDALVAQVSKLHSNSHTIQHPQGDSTSKEVFGESSTSTAVVDAHKMTSPIPSAPPPPLSPSSSFGKTSWSMKVEGSNEGTAEGSVEIPERQSVATLREQIANKLEVKAPNGTKAVVHNARERHRSNITPFSTELPPKSPVPFQKFMADSLASQVGNHQRMQTSIRNQTPDSTAQVVKPIVHEPAMRHVSCITPLPFSRSAPQSASLQSTPVYTPASKKSLPNDFHRNYDGTNLQESICNGGVFHEDKYTTKAAVRDDGIASIANSLSFLSKSDVINEGSDSAIDLTPPATKTTSESTKYSNGYTSDYMLASPSSTSVQSPQPEMPPFSTPFDPESERSTQALTSPASRSGAAAGSGDVPSPLDASAMRDDSSKRCPSSQRSDMNIQQQSDTSYWYKHMFKKMHRIEQGDQSVLKYRARDFASPTPSYHSSRAWTPTPRLESRPESRLEYECAPRRSKSVGRYVDSSLHNDEDIVERWREERARLSARSPTSIQKSFNSTQPSAAVHTNGVSSCGASPTLSSHETNNRFAWERSKIAHFHLPTYRFQRDEDSRPITGWSMNCMRCGRMRRELSWREIEFLYNSLGKKDVHRESINECLNGRISSAMIGERLDETCRQLQQFLESLDGYRRRTYSSPQLSTLSVVSNNPLTECIPSTSKENGSTSRDFLELKKSVKEEMINRQRVEKLTEELEQQRSRRHGYVPSASPALQKNFDRFDGLLNDFGRDGRRSVTPARTTPAIIATCTALYSFKAQSARELSFNRGDVIRVHRIVDLNWLEGERNGQIGIFPSSYVQMDERLTEERMKLIALFPFFARNRNELSLKKGEIVRYRRSIDSNWMEGVNSRGEIGIFPKTYVQEIRDSGIKFIADFDIDSCTPDRPKTPKIFTPMQREESPLPSKKMSHGDEVHAWQKKHTNDGLSGPAQIIPRNAETYRALYAYKPQNVDELELCENDIVFVVEKCDDGWYIGTSLRSGQFGTFPGNYVERH